MNMALVLQIINLLNAAEPGIASLIMMIRNSDGTISIGALLDQADAQFDANIKQIADWQKAHSSVAKP